MLSLGAVLREGTWVSTVLSSEAGKEKKHYEYAVYVGMMRVSATASSLVRPLQYGKRVAE
jgi:hypothetical protein